MAHAVDSCRLVVGKGIQGSTHHMQPTGLPIGAHRPLGKTLCRGVRISCWPRWSWPSRYPDPAFY